MPVVTKQIREGPHFAYRVIAVAERNAEGRLICPTFEFFQDAESREPHDLLKLSERLTFLAENGVIRDSKKFKRLDPTDLYELRTRHGLRLICFYDDNRDIVCTNGTIKKKDDLENADVETAQRWQGLYFAAKKSGTLSHEPEHTNETRNPQQRR